MLKGLGGLGDMAKMMNAAQEMQGKIAQAQEDMARMQEDLANTIVTGEAGAGLVKVQCNAKGDFTGLDIDPSILQASEKEVVEDLILAAIKDAKSRAETRAASEMAKITEAMGLPKDMKMPFG